jgi:hypothetical protein
MLDTAKEKFSQAKDAVLRNNRKRRGEPGTGPASDDPRA